MTSTPMPALQFILTTAGKAAIVNANNTGTNPVVIDRVAVGSTSWTPTAAATALSSEIKKISAVGGAAVANDTIHVTATDSSSDVYTVREIGLYTDGNVLLAIYSQASPIITKGADTVALIAADLVITGIPAGSVTVGDANFDYPQATQTVKGVLELATNSETQTGTDDERAVTPLKLANLLGLHGLPTAAAIGDGNAVGSVTRSGFYRGNSTNTGVPVEVTENDFDLIHVQAANGDATQILFAAANKLYVRIKDDGTNWGSWEKLVTFSSEASTSATGVIELATAAEAQTGADTTRAITPSTLGSVLGLFGLPILKNLGNGFNLDLITGSGLFRGNSTCVNMPADAAGTDFDLISLIASDGDASQILIATNQKIYFRVADSGGSYSAWEKFVLTSTAATTSAPGIVELATSTETQTGADTERAVTPAGLASLTATSTRAGLVELATDAETQSGTDTTRAVTPSSLDSRTAPTSRTGLIEIATQTETDTGTDTARAVTPQTMRLYAGVSRAWVIFNGSGTVSIIRSHNVASITDRGVGRYTINMATAFGTSDYCYVAAARQVNDGNDSCTVSPRLSETKTSSALQITVTEGGGVDDSSEICVAMFS